MQRTHPMMLKFWGTEETDTFTQSLISAYSLISSKIRACFLVFCGYYFSISCLDYSMFKNVHADFCSKFLPSISCFAQKVFCGERSKSALLQNGKIWNCWSNQLYLGLFRNQILLSLKVRPTCQPPKHSVSSKKLYLKRVACVIMSGKMHFIT